jgi:WD40 repeat protein
MNMLRRVFLSTSLGLALLAITACNGSSGDHTAADDSDVPDTSYKDVKIDTYLYPPIAPKEQPQVAPVGSSPRPDPIVITDCHLNAFEKEDVPATQDGTLLFIGTEIKPGEKVPDELLIEAPIGKETKKFRRLREGDVVDRGQLMAMLDDRLARDDHEIKKAKEKAAWADYNASDKTKLEAKARYDTQLRLRNEGKRATSEEDVRAAKLLWDKSTYDADNKRALIEVAEKEANQALTKLRYNEIRAEIPGIIKTIYKTRGESVKNMEPVFQVRNLANLRVEGLVDYQYVYRMTANLGVRPGMKAVLEPSEPRGPGRTLIGHLQEITGVAFGRNKDNKTLIVSTSEDVTARVWDPLATSKEERIVHLPHVGRAVACTGPGAKNNWFLVGCADGVARLFDLDEKSDKAIREFPEHHKGAILCVAFSPDGASCATGGEDRQICLWDTATGKLRYKLPGAHKGAVTSLQFTPRCQLVSAGRDSSIQAWTLGDKAARRENTNLNQRSGDVAQLGVSPDGRCVLFDQGRTLRILSLEAGLNEGIMQNPQGVPPFSSFALYSPDGNLVLTASGSEGRIQLWRVPSGNNVRGYEVRQLVPDKKAAVTCAAFCPEGPDKPYLATGTKNNHVLVWGVPKSKDLEQTIGAEVILVEQAVESNSQVRVWAQLKNPGGLLPGTTGTLVIDSGVVDTSGR